MARPPEDDDRYQDRLPPRRWEDVDAPDAGRPAFRPDEEYEDNPFRRRADVPNYLTQSILCTLLCCWPLGIVAIVNAAQVNNKLATGDSEGAQKASDRARLWCWLSFLLGLIAVPLFVGLQILVESIDA
jgi:hypothetical protein